MAYTDKNGVLRWNSDKSEIHGFGVNYTVPFAHEYRMIKNKGMSHEETINSDVYHMARLDVDLYRIHVWDTEISDTLGNLINNDHLRLLDYTIHQMKKRRMHFIITPIAYWGNGWPEPDEKTPGFSYKYGKSACLTNPDAINAQANYLYQFMNHVNPYTNTAYKDEPGIIGFEISNEPHHNGTETSVIEFINTLVSSIRKSGCRKPLFYNMSHSIHLANAYLGADIQGGTFQWYPTNLVANRQINGNFLPLVASYEIPFATDPGFKKMAKIVYEFDPADAGGNVLYAAMAETFRKTGMQLAAQFDYDAITWAPYNTNYGTHFLNMAYTPQKAISMKIASAVFHHIPMYQTGSLQTPLKIDYLKDLAEWNSPDKFFYSNNTATTPVNVDSLKEIAGFGSSPVIIYTGSGIYFMDKLAQGLWRLEIMPDAYWIADPYAPADTEIQKAAVKHTIREMQILLPEMAQGFSLTPLNKDNHYHPEVQNNGRFQIIPGTYLVRTNGNASSISQDQPYKNIIINEYEAPASNLTKTALWNLSSTKVSKNNPEIRFKIASPVQVSSVKLVMSNNNLWETISLPPGQPENYAVPVPATLCSVGYLKYQIVVETGSDTTLFPSGQTGDPFKWSNRDSETYQMTILPAGSPIILWEAENDWEFSYTIWNRNVMLKPASSGNAVLNINLDKLPQHNPADSNERDYAFKFYFGDKIGGQMDALMQKKTLVMDAHCHASSVPVEIGLIDKNGTAIAAEMLLEPGKTHYKIDLSLLKKASNYNIPRPYPEFLRYKNEPANAPFDFTAPEMLQVVIKPGKDKTVNVDIEKIALE